MGAKAVIEADSLQIETKRRRDGETKWGKSGFFHFVSTSLRLFVSLSLAIIAPAITRADMKTQTISYRQGGTTFQGYLAYDDSIAGPRPGVLSCPKWWGLTDYPKHRAE